MNVHLLRVSTFWKSLPISFDHATRKLIYNKFHFFVWSVGEKVPSIPRIQQFIEAAWTSGKRKLLVNAFKSSENKYFQENTGKFHMLLS